MLKNVRIYKGLQLPLRSVLGRFGSSYPLFTLVRGRGILRSSPSDDAYRAEHRASCRPPDLVDPQEVGELVDFVLRKMLQVLVLEDVNALPRQQVDVHRVEASPLLELILGRSHLQGRGVAAQ